MGKKAIVIGGSNGIGLALGNLLIERGYQLEIYDRSEPDRILHGENKVNYHYCNLLDFNESLFEDITADEDVEVLLITAGIGRVADFSAHHISEISDTISIDLTAVLRIIRIFYNRINSTEQFFTGVMASISGRISTPGAAVYAAAKAGVVRFIESVNIELEGSKTDNRILEISPGSFKGSKFYGGDNDLSLMNPLAIEILEHLFGHDTVFIPQYDEVFRGVIERYQKDPVEYGKYSYRFKKESDRFNNNKRVKVGYLPIEDSVSLSELINTIRKAKEKCNYLIVGIDKSINQAGELNEVLSACKYVDKVVIGKCESDFDICFK